MTSPFLSAPRRRSESQRSNDHDGLTNAPTSSSRARDVLAHTVAPKELP